jgi:hypothetical protein
MRALTATAILLATVFFVRAEVAGFEVDNGVAVTGGVVRVNYVADKSHTLSLGPAFRLRLMEVQITMTNGRVKRHTMFFAGTHFLRVPLPIEFFEILGPLFLLGLVCGLVVMLSSRFGRAEPFDKTAGTALKQSPDPPSDSGFRL